MVRNLNANRLKTSVTFMLGLAISILFSSFSFAATVPTDHFDIEAKPEVLIGRTATLVISAKDKQGQLMKSAKHDLKVIITSTQKNSEEQTVRMKKGGQVEVQVPVVSYNLIVQVIDQKTGQTVSDIIPAKVPMAQKGAAR